MGKGRQHFVGVDAGFEQLEDTLESHETVGVLLLHEAAEENREIPLGGGR